MRSSALTPSSTGYANSHTRSGKLATAARSLAALAAVLLISACSPAGSAPEQSATLPTSATLPGPAVPLPSPYFDLDAVMLEELLRDLAAAQPGLLSREELSGILDPQQTPRFLELVHSVLLQPAEYFLLADKQNSLDQNYEPADLVRLETLTNPHTGFGLALSRPDHSLRRVLLDDLFAMDAAATAAGVTLVYSSTYRSFAYQEGTYNRWVRELGQVEADRVSAQPGKSQHQLGTVVDFGSITEAFADTAAGKWMLENGWAYGFSLSYPRGMEAETGYAWEPWHYRWIGRQAAALTREFFAGLQYRFLYFWDSAREMFLIHVKADF